MEKKEFLNLKGTYKRVPLYKVVKAKNQHPIDIYEIFMSSGSYFLESAEIDMKWGRYSIIGLPSSNYLKVKDGKIYLKNENDFEIFKKNSKIFFFF